MDRVRQDEHGVKSLAATAPRCCALNFIPVWLWGFAPQDPEEDLLHVRGSLRHLFRAEEFDPNKGDGEIERGEDEIDTERVPPVGLDEVFETLRDGGVGRRDVLDGLCEAGWGWAVIAGEEEDGRPAGSEEGEQSAEHLAKLVRV